VKLVKLYAEIHQSGASRSAAVSTFKTESQEPSKNALDVRDKIWPSRCDTVVELGPTGLAGPT